MDAIFVELLKNNPLTDDNAAKIADIVKSNYREFDKGHSNDSRSER